MINLEYAILGHVGGIQLVTHVGYVTTAVMVAVTMVTSYENSC